MVGMIFRLAGQPGHGRTAFVRRQPVRIVDGRFEGGYTGVFELICPGCGDNPYADYSEVPSRHQLLRGPLTLAAALEAYDKHLGPLPGPNGDSAGSSGPGHVAATKAAAAGTIGLAVSRVSSPGVQDSVTGTGSGVVPAPRPPDRGDPWLGTGSNGVYVGPLPGQPGHGSAAHLRRQPVRIVDGRAEGGYTGVFELVCPDCGDRLDLEYSEVPPRLQWLRGPRPLLAGLTAFHRHLGLA
jgi:hypothetical protein